MTRTPVVSRLEIQEWLAKGSLCRMEAIATADARWCAFASDQDNWILGAGFVAFQVVFPVYRDPDCAGIFGISERARCKLAVSAPILPP